ncbi:MAG: hypothetical protein NC311_15275 [Muribaculaceae bacterium]|nr:hypothetical protein [Muribaculaceae bacterium]
MTLTKYLDPDGQAHTVRTEYSFGSYIIYLDGKLYAQADDRNELDDAVRELVKYKKYTVARKKSKKISRS